MSASVVTVQRNVRTVTVSRGSAAPVQIYRQATRTIQLVQSRGPKGDNGLNGADGAAASTIAQISGLQTALDSKPTKANTETIDGQWTFTNSALSVDNNGHAGLWLDGGAGSFSKAIWTYTAGIAGWNFGHGTTGNWFVDRYNTSGVYQDTPLLIDRTTGKLTISQRPAFGTATPWDNANFTPPVRNRILNPAMQISQEFAVNVSQTVAGPSTAKYIADGFVLSNVTDGTIVANQNNSIVAPSGSPYRLAAAPSVVDASIAAGQVVTLNWYLEGLDVADLQWGTASAKTVTVRFVFRTNLAGTYGFSIINAATNRSYVQTFTVAAGEVSTDKVVTFVIPGDTTGTWASDTTKGLECRIALAAGTTYTTASTGWQAGNFIGITGSQANWMSSTSNNVYLADVGLYVGATAPAFEVPSYADELRRCMRYWEQVSIGTFPSITGGVPTGTFRVPKRAAPTLSWTFAAGTGATYTALSTDGFFQGVAHSVITTATITGNARL